MDNKPQSVNKKTAREEYEDSEFIHWPAVVISLSAVLAYFYFLVFPGEAKLDYTQAALGATGDFFGGLINPLVGLLTVVLIYKSIHIQRKELKETNDAFRNQNIVIFQQSFEQTFFAWLASYRELVASIPSGIAEVAYGRSALRRIWEENFENSEFSHLVDCSVGYTEVTKYHDRSFGFSPISQQKLLEALLKRWEDVYGQNRHHLDSVFRTLYRLIKWIDGQPEVSLDNDKKWHYVSIVRAQLSEIELIFLLLNGHTDRGQRMNKYVNDYALFDNLDTEREAAVSYLSRLPTLLQAIDNPAVVSSVKSSLERCTIEERAYSSDIARAYRDRSDAK